MHGIQGKRMKECTEMKTTLFGISIQARYLILSLLILAGTGILGYIYGKPVFEWAGNIIWDVTHIWVLIALFAVLPMLGFPVSLFLIIMGIRMGVLYTILTMVLVFPVQLAISFFLAKTLLYPFLVKILKKKDISLPEVKSHNSLRVSVLFMAIPGPSFAMKNYLLPLSGVRFSHFFISGLFVQSVLALPFIVLGKAAKDANIAIAGGMFLVFLLFIIGGRYLSKRLHPETKKMDENPVGIQK